MRIIAGSEKKRKLLSLRGKRVRPTMDRIKTTLFDILAPYMKNNVFLDLFAGTGNVGIEALSRGCGYVYFVDNKRYCTVKIRENLSLTKFNDRAAVITQDGLKAIKTFHNKKIYFDVIFVDPPYDTELYKDVISYLNRFDILRNDGIVVFQHPYKKAFPGVPEYLKLWKRRKIGESCLTFFKKMINLDCFSIEFR